MKKKVKLNVKAINKAFSESSETPNYGNDEPTVWVSWLKEIFENCRKTVTYPYSSC